MLLVILAVIQIVLLAVFVILFLTKGRGDLRSSVPELLTGLANLHASAERFEGKISGDMRTLREDSLTYSKQARQEAAAEARSLREEMSTHLGRLGGQLNDNLSEFRRDQVSAANQLRDGVTAQIDRLVNTTTESDQQLRDVMQEKFAGLQQQVTGQLTDFSDHQVQTSEQLKDSIQTNFSRLGSELRETNKELSGKVQGSLVDLTGRIQGLSATNEQKQDALRQVVELRLDKLTESNNEKLEQMRQTVDEKLHTTLEKRLTDSFGLVTEQLGRVQLGLGEMKDLANGVGDLKRVLTNVKTRGGFGEVQLGLLLDQMLSPEQYITNARIREDSQESVEYAIRMPGTCSVSRLTAKGFPICQSEVWSNRIACPYDLSFRNGSTASDSATSPGLVAQAGNGNCTRSGIGISGWDTITVPGLRIPARVRLTGGKKLYS